MASIDCCCVPKRPPRVVRELSVPHDLRGDGPTCALAAQTGAVRGELWLADVMQLLGRLPDGSVDLVVADPPYAIDKADWDEFESLDVYLAWCDGWLAEVARVLAPHGSAYVCGFSEILADVKARSARRFASCRWLIWYYRNKANLGRDWGRSHESILHLRKTGARVDVDAIRIPYNGHTTKYPARIQAVSSQYGGASAKRDRWEPNPLGAKPRDVIELPVICNGMAEKTPHATQKPEALIEKLILASSAPGQLVVDPFVGSGTTAVVANRLGRSWLAGDGDARFVGLTRERLAAQPSLASAKRVNLPSSEPARESPEMAPVNRERRGPGGARAGAAEAAPARADALASTRRGRRKTKSQVVATPPAERKALATDAGEPPQPGARRAPPLRAPAPAPIARSAATSVDSPRRLPWDVRATASAGGSSNAPAVGAGETAAEVESSMTGPVGRRKARPSSAATVPRAAREVAATVELSRASPAGARETAPEVESSMGRPVGPRSVGADKAGVVESPKALRVGADKARGVVESPKASRVSADKTRGVVESPKASRVSADKALGVVEPPKASRVSADKVLGVVEPFEASSMSAGETPAGDEPFRALRVGADEAPPVVDATVRPPLAVRKASDAQTTVLAGQQALPFDLFPY